MNKHPSNVSETASNKPASNATAFTLPGTAVAPYRAFTAALSNGDTCPVHASNGTDWQDFIGTYSAGTLAQTTLLESSTGSWIDWSAGADVLLEIAWLGATGEDADAHLSSASNPHSVTAAQVGSYTFGAVDTLLTGKSDTGHTHTGVYEPASAGIQSHISDTTLHSVGTQIHAATEKTTPVDADELGLVDSAASNVLKKLTWANLKATLTSIFALLAGKAGGQTLIGGSAVTDALVLQGTSGNGTAASPAVQMKAGNNGATTALTALNNGNVGIGTTNPTSKFQILSGTNTNFQLGNTASNYNTSATFTDLSSLINTINLSRNSDGAYTESVFNYNGSNGLSNLGLVTRGNIKLVTGGTTDRGLTIKSTGVAGFTGNIGVLNTNPVAPIHIGNLQNFASSNDPGILIARSVSDAYGSGSAHGFVDMPEISRTAAGATGYASFDARTLYSGSSDYNHYVGVQSLPIYGSSGTLLNSYGVFHGLTINSGTITNSYGAKLLNSIGAGTVTNQYAIYIENQTKGSSLNYSIYSAGGTNYFAGNVGIWTTNPSAKLTVNTGNIHYNTTYTDASNYERLAITGTAGSNVQIKAETAGTGADNLSILLTPAGTGNVGIGTTAPSALLDINSDTLRVRTSRTPASATATGNAGDVCWDANYIYVCTATNTWKRSAISTW